MCACVFSLTQLPSSIIRFCQAHINSFLPLMWFCPTPTQCFCDISYLHPIHGIGHRISHPCCLNPTLTIIPPLPTSPGFSSPTTCSQLPPTTCPSALQTLVSLMQTSALSPWHPYSPAKTQPPPPAPFLIPYDSLGKAGVIGLLFETQCCF